MIGTDVRTVPMVTTERVSFFYISFTALGNTDAPTVLDSPPTAHEELDAVE